MVFKISEILIKTGLYMVDEDGNLVFDEHGKLVYCDETAELQRQQDQRSAAKTNLDNAMAEKYKDVVVYSSGLENRLSGDGITVNSEGASLYSNRDKGDDYYDAIFEGQFYTRFNTFLEYIIGKNGGACNDIPEEYSEWLNYTYYEILELEESGILVPDEVLEWARAMQNQYADASVTDEETIDETQADDEKSKLQKETLKLNAKTEEAKQETDEKFQKLQESKTSAEQIKKEQADSKNNSLKKIEGLTQEWNDITSIIKDGKKLSPDKQNRLKELGSLLNGEDGSLMKNLFDSNTELEDLINTMDGLTSDIEYNIQLGDETIDVAEELAEYKAELPQASVPSDQTVEIEAGTGGETQSLAKSEDLPFIAIQNANNLIEFSTTLNSTLMLNEYASLYDFAKIYTEDSTETINSTKEAMGDKFGMNSDEISKEVDELPDMTGAETERAQMEEAGASLIAQAIHFGSLSAEETEKLEGTDEELLAKIEKIVEENNKDEKIVKDTKKDLENGKTSTPTNPKENLNAEELKEKINSRKQKGKKDLEKSENKVENIESDVPQGPGSSAIDYGTVSEQVGNELFDNPHFIIGAAIGTYAINRGKGAQEAGTRANQLAVENGLATSLTLKSIQTGKTEVDESTENGTENTVAGAVNKAARTGKSKQNGTPEINEGNALAESKKAQKDGDNAKSDGAKAQNDIKKIITEGKEADKETLKNTTDAEKKKKQLENELKVNEKLLKKDYQKISKLNKENIEDIQRQVQINAQMETLNSQSEIAQAAIEANSGNQNAVQPVGNASVLDKPQGVLASGSAQGGGNTNSAEMALIQANGQIVNQLSGESQTIKARVHKNIKTIAKLNLSASKRVSKSRKLSKAIQKEQKAIEKAEKAKQAKMQKNLSAIDIIKQVFSIIGGIGSVLSYIVGPILIAIGTALEAAVVTAPIGIALQTAGAMLKAYVGPALEKIGTIGGIVVNLANGIHQCCIGDIKAGLIAIGMAVVQAALVILSIGGIGGKVGDAASKAGEVAEKTGEVAEKAGEVAEKAGDVAGKAGDVAGKAGDVAGKAGDVAGKAGDAAGKAGDVAGKTGDAAGKAGDAASKTSEAASKTGEAASKTGDAASKTGEVAGKAGETSESFKQAGDFLKGAGNIANIVASGYAIKNDISILQGKGLDQNAIKAISIAGGIGGLFNAAGGLMNSSMQITENAAKLAQFSGAVIGTAGQMTSTIAALSDPDGKSKGAKIAQIIGGGLASAGSIISAGGQLGQNWSKMNGVEKSSAVINMTAQLTQMMANITSMSAQLNGDKDLGKAASYIALTAQIMSAVSAMMSMGSQLSEKISAAKAKSDKTNEDTNNTTNSNEGNIAGVSETGIQTQQENQTVIEDAKEEVNNQTNISGMDGTEQAVQDPEKAQDATKDGKSIQDNEVKSQNGIDAKIDKSANKLDPKDRAAIAAMAIGDIGKIMSTIANLISTIHQAEGVKNSNEEKYLQLIGQSLSAVASVIDMGTKMSEDIERKAQQKEENQQKAETLDGQVAEEMKKPENKNKTTEEVRTEIKIANDSDLAKQVAQIKQAKKDSKNDFLYKGLDSDTDIVNFIEKKEDQKKKAQAAQEILQYVQAFGQIGQQMVSTVAALEQSNQIQATSSSRKTAEYDFKHGRALMKTVKKHLKKYAH